MHRVITRLASFVLAICLSVLLIPTVAFGSPEAKEVGKGGVTTSDENSKQDPTRAEGVSGNGASIETLDIEPAFVPWDGAGTEADPYIIANLTDLADLRDAVNGGSAFSGVHFALTGTIDLGGSVTPWTPIGWCDYNSDTWYPFEGDFDGAGYTISGLYIEEDTGYEGSSATYGLFGYCNEATIENLDVVGTLRVVTDGYVWDCLGGVVGWIEIGDDETSGVSNCSFSGSIYSDNDYDWVDAGGIAGYISSEYGFDVTISNCTNNASIAVDGSSCEAGGLVGYAWLNYYQDVELGTDEAITYPIVFVGCSNTGSIDANVDDNAYIGGLIGCAYNSVQVDSCSNTGALDVHSEDYYAYVGGFVGYAEDYAASLDSTNAGAIGVESDYESYAGGLFGYVYYDVTIVGSVNTGSIHVSTYDEDAYAGGLVGYAYDNTHIDESTNAGAVTADSEYYEAYAGGLAGYVEEDVDANNSDNNGNVGAFSNEYSAYAGGLVGYIDGSDYITIATCSNSGAVTADAYSYACSGGLIGESGYTIDVIDSSNTGAISCTSASSVWPDAGGLIGYCYYDAYIEGCSNYGDVTSVCLYEEDGGYADAGGLIGYIYDDLTVVNSCNYGDLSASSVSPSYGGGLAGYIDTSFYGSFANSYNSGNVSAYYAGGLVGQGNVEIINCYNRGDLTGTVVGGLIASLVDPFGQYDFSEFEAPLINSYWKAGVDPIGELYQQLLVRDLGGIVIDDPRDIYMMECYSFTNPATGVLSQAPRLYVMSDGSFVATTTTSLLDALRLFVALNQGYGYTTTGLQDSYEDWAAVSWQNGGYPIFDKDKQPEPTPETIPETRSTLPLTGDSLPAGLLALGGLAAAGGACMLLRRKVLR